MSSRTGFDTAVMKGNSATESPFLPQCGKHFAYVILKLLQKLLIKYVVEGLMSYNANDTLLQYAADEYGTLFQFSKQGHGICM